MTCFSTFYIFFFFNDTATTEIYTLSLHDALPISVHGALELLAAGALIGNWGAGLDAFLEWIDIGQRNREDRKSTRLNSSHSQISYAVFCLKKKNNIV